GTDPFSGTAIPVATTVSVGAAPIVFVTSTTRGPLATVTNGTDAQLKNIFSGATCNPSTLGAPAKAIQAYLREPLSGPMNTTEYSVFRYPNENGLSQEKRVNHLNLSNTACAAGGGGRTRAIGTGEEVNGVKGASAAVGMDGIGYAFFSYGNVSGIASSARFRYLKLNGEDGIFANYAGRDPGHPGNATLHATAN